MEEEGNRAGVVSTVSTLSFGVHVEAKTRNIWNKTPSVFLAFIDFCNYIINAYSSAQVVKCSIDYFLLLVIDKHCRI